MNHETKKEIIEVFKIGVHDIFNTEISDKKAVHLLNQPNTMFIAYPNLENILAFTFNTIERCPFTDKTVFYVNMLWVDEDYRGTKVFKEIRDLTQSIGLQIADYIEFSLRADLGERFARKLGTLTHYTCRIELIPSRF